MTNEPEGKIPPEELGWWLLREITGGTPKESDMAIEHYAAQSLPESDVWQSLDCAVVDLPLFAPITKSVGRYARKMWPNDTPVRFAAKAHKLGAEDYELYLGSMRGAVLPEIFTVGTHLVHTLVNKICPAEPQDAVETVLEQVLADDELRQFRQRWFARARDVSLRGRTASETIGSRIDPRRGRWASTEPRPRPRRRLFGDGLQRSRGRTASETT